MSELTPRIAADVVQVCQQGAAEAAAALSRALDSQFTLTVGQPGTLTLEQLREKLASPGLAVVLTTSGAGAVVLIAESSGLLPAWCPQPDATGTSKLTTLAQELGMILLPEEHIPEDFAAGYVGNLGEGLRAGEVATDAAIVPLEVQRAGSPAQTIHLLWPVAKPAAVLTVGSSPSTPQAAPPPARPAPAPPSSPVKAAPARPRSVSLGALPIYVRSLLRIKVPVVVTLAQKRQPLSRIMELGPGSIIQFDKSCEEMLELDVGGRAAATGEAVKVGDKFGLRITTIVLPDERFGAVRKDGSPARPAKRSA